MFRKKCPCTQIKNYGCNMLQIKRDIYLNKLINRRENGMIKVITGIRRCGKSYLLFELFYDYLLSTGVRPEQITRLSLDDDNNEEYRDSKRLSNFLRAQIKEGEMHYFLLDEVQLAISDEERKNKDIRLYGIFNGLLRMRNVDVYVTGSNSKFLSSDVLTEFRGRGDEVRIYPLTFGEFLSAYDGDKFSAYREYSIYGGMPLILSFKDETDKANYLNNLFAGNYLKDVLERYKLRGDVVMDTLVDILASDIGSLTNPTKLVNTFLSREIKTNEKTVSSYIDYLIDAFLIRKADRYDIKGKKYIGSPFKYYFADVGLRNARLNFRQLEETHIMENIIYNELLVRGFNVDVGVVEHRILNNDGKKPLVRMEVDFVCNQASRRYYIQSAYAIPDKEKMAQESASLDRIGDSFKKIIIVHDYTSPWHNEKGYLIINIIDFLLNPDSLEL